LKGFLKIVGVGAVLFMATAMIQEWRVFVGAWTGAGVTRPAVQDGEPKDTQVEDTVRRYVSMARHFYQTGGDRRFAERIPASPEVVQELVDDVAYLAKNKRRQEDRLVALDVLHTSRPAENRARVRTRERWEARTRGLDESGAADPMVAQVIFVEYWLQREGSKWQVSRWELIDAPAERSR